MLNTLSFLSVIGLVAINTPGPAAAIINVFFQFAQLDILPTDQIFPYLFEFDEVTDYALNPEFDALGISSMNFLKNMGSAFIFMMSNLGILGLIVFCKILKRYFRV
jgi:hypothetical protein